MGLQHLSPERRRAIQSAGGRAAQQAAREGRYRINRSIPLDAVRRGGRIGGLRSGEVRRRQRERRLAGLRQVIA